VNGGRQAAKAIAAQIAQPLSRAAKTERAGAVPTPPTPTRARSSRGTVSSASQPRHFVDAQAFAAWLEAHHDDPLHAAPQGQRVELDHCASRRACVSSRLALVTQCTTGRRIRG